MEPTASPPDRGGGPPPHLHSPGEAPGLRRGGGAHRISTGTGAPGAARALAASRGRSIPLERRLASGAAVEPTAPPFPWRGAWPQARRWLPTAPPFPWRGAWPQARRWLPTASPPALERPGPPGHWPRAAAGPFPWRGAWPQARRWSPPHLHQTAVAPHRISTGHSGEAPGLRRGGGPPPHFHSPGEAPGLRRGGGPPPHFHSPGDAPGLRRGGGAHRISTKRRWSPPHLHMKPPSSLSLVQYAPSALSTARPVRMRIYRSSQTDQLRT